MSRLSSSTLLPDVVAQPSYDRANLQPGIIHMGLGAFHRAHQAVYTQRALSEQFGGWGIVAVNLRSPDPVEALAKQDGLYSIIVRNAEGDTAEVIGATVDWLCAAERGTDVLDYLANETIKIVTLTVSEKAYGLDPVTGGLDLKHPSVAADLANPHAPVGAVGFLVEGLAKRREKGIAPYTVLCCDNLPSNGHVVRRLVLDMAERRDPELARWIAEKGAFPCSMVDRIVPAATAESRARAEALLGVEDTLSIETEPFMQWVIEENFVSGRPAWEAGGAVFAKAVEPYEKMKLRLLNGPHTMIAHLGILNDLEFVRDVMAVPEFVEKVRRHMQAAVKTLDPVPGIDLPAYMDELVERFANPTIAHKNIQIAMDTSQKLPQRVLAATVETLEAGQDAAAFASVIALWIASIHKRGSLDDPRREEILAAAGNVDPSDPSASFFAIDGLFPPALVQNRAWRDRVNAELQSLKV
ncbi:mannitol dehydrogenase family protein [Agrobacterium tumefaciens]|uniref:Mannitol dehydrogenase family protein n=2 Tax=Rhizobium rhizogenes TaxID=359 RepID=A0AA92H9J7_RHIRH|nr:mannitol dehydrogenase family protein [Rhizobium rhizogenes]PVE54899.1 mannitol dehydrogenase family protein [Rhizobium rhizogenes]PVE67454.1 mannitol dehydrogenase family protein [Agrobacterium tumefaciens]PVE77231.1 mannitol dehydrogenase family protein [Sphingomonas sp. TPD3009]